MLFSRIITASVLCLATQFAQAQITIKAWVTIKDNVTNAFPVYSTEQKDFVAGQVQQMLSIYVNRDSKIDHYGYDPIPEIERIRKEAPAMNDKEFHLSMSKMILKLRDFHTSYVMPMPYSCYMIVYPLEFDLLDSSDLVQEPIAAVKSRSFLPFDQIVPAIKNQVQIGDILVKINGMTLKEYYEANKHVTGGANEFGGLRSALNHFSMRSGASGPLPEEGFVVYELKHYPEDTETYVVAVPMLAIQIDSCIADYQKMLDTGKTVMDIPDEEVDEEEDGEDNADEDMEEEEKEDDEAMDTADELLKNDDEASGSEEAEGIIGGDGDRIATPASLFPAGFGERKILSPKRQLEIMATQSYMDDIKRVFSPSESKIQMFMTPEKIISYGIYDYEDIKMGIIRLDSFMPASDPSGTKSIEIVRGLLVNQLKNTDCLVFDVRRNGGGIVTIADNLMQFFTTNGEPTEARALVAPINEKIFLETPMGGAGWKESYSEVKPGDKYTPLVKFGKEGTFSYYGQAYVKPVGVFTDAHCYSSCDIFAANMQDSGAAIIFGEDPQTGAGGANVVDHSGFFSKTLPDIFQTMPFGQDMRIGWRQTVRTGRNSGKLVEDDGVKADFVVRPKPQDLYLNQTRSTQYDRIASKLAAIGRENGRSYTNFIAEPQVQGNSEVGSPVQFDIQMSMLSRVELRKDGEAIGHFEVSAGNATSRQLIKQTLRSDEEITTTTLEKYTLVAFNEAGEQIVSTNRYMRFTPRASTHLNIPVNGTIAWDFSLQPDSFSAIYHYQGSEPEAGWSVKDGALVVFDGTTYKDMTNSAISFFLNVPAETESSPSVHIKADIDTEVDCDYLIVTVSHPKRGIMIVMAESGKKDIDQTFKLDRFKGLSGVEMEIRFVSDPMLVVGPVRVTKVEFSA